MNLTLEDTEKNLGLITSNNIEFPFTNIISDNYDFSNNSSIKKDNIFLHVNDEKSFVDGEESIYFRTLEQSKKIDELKCKTDIFNDQKNYLDGKNYKESIQLKIRKNIYLKKPFKEKKSLGRKKKSLEGLGEHNRFSDDNLIRKCKHVILDSVMIFINRKIKMLYPGINNKLLKQKKLFKLKQNHSISSRVNYNKCFLNKTLKLIFSEDISSKYKRYSPSHNKDVIESLINEKDEIIKSQFNSIFNLTFSDCLKHFRGIDVIEELKGLNQLEDYIKRVKINNNEEEYFNIFKFFIYNFERIIMEKKVRKKRKKYN